MENNTVVPTAEVADVQENVAARYHEDDFLNELYAKMTDHNQDTNKLNSRVGDTGIAPGEQFTLTGELKVAEVKDEAGNVTSVYPAFVTKEGKEISVKQFMGVSSLVGYVFDNKTEYPHQYTDANGEHTDMIKSNVKTGFNGTPKSWFSPSQRVLKDFILYVRTHKAEFANKKATYLGYAIKPYTAKQDGSSPFGDESWSADNKRVIKQKLWKLN